MIEVIIVEPNITEEENSKNLKEVEEILEEIVREIKIKGSKNKK
ncbi:hypothetical protein [Clostridium botulinum]|nr:hypothetical protein [Clostridium botulinum]EES49406.1 hypothetical protein CLO_3663 [Clostridium botulinum E1 str. 'BoNT E Beluga']